MTPRFCRVLLAALLASVIPARSDSAPLAKADAMVNNQKLLQAIEHEKAGQWREALESWKQWSAIDCCVPSPMATERAHRIVLCHVRLGETKAAVSNCLEVVFNPNYFRPAMLKRAASHHTDITLACAIAQHGDEGMALLRDITFSPDYAKSRARQAAQSYLNDPQPYGFSGLEVKLDKIEPGSLPRSYPGMTQ